MSGHLDDAEHCMTEPIVSISLGCSGIFLIGGRTKDVRPIPILLRSGDAVIMAEESRYCYHGISAILPAGVELPSDGTYFRQYRGDFNTSMKVATGDTQRTDIVEEGEGDTFVVDYLRTHRINMNVRRVTREDGVWKDKNGSGYKPQT